MTVVEGNGDLEISKIFKRLIQKIISE
jgi:hypothetical protein